jgi:hypothetical protein
VKAHHSRTRFVPRPLREEELVAPAPPRDALIGPAWTDPTDSGERVILDPTDSGVRRRVDPTDTRLRR